MVVVVYQTKCANQKLCSLHAAVLHPPMTAPAGIVDSDETNLLFSNRSSFLEDPAEFQTSKEIERPFAGFFEGRDFWADKAPKEFYISLDHNILQFLKTGE